MSMGLSGDGLHSKVLAAFSPVLNLSFSSGVLRYVGHKVVLGHIIGPSKGFYCVSLTIGLLGLGFGP